MLNLLILLLKPSVQPKNRSTDLSSKHANDKDMAVVALLLSGDKAAFSELVKTYYTPMKRLSLGFVSNEAVAEEMVQETWVAVLNGIQKFEGRSSLKSWIFSILVNKSKTCGVKDKRMVPFSSFGNADDEHGSAVDPDRFNDRGMWRDPPVPWNESGPEHASLQKEAHECLLAAIAGLEPKQRMIVTLKDMEDMDSKEICNILQISETYQRVLLHRARSVLRGRMEAFMEER